MFKNINVNKKININGSATLLTFVRDFQEMDARIIYRHGLDRSMDHIQAWIR